MRGGATFEVGNDPGRGVTGMVPVDGRFAPDGFTGATWGICGVITAGSAGSVPRSGFRGWICVETWVDGGIGTPCDGVAVGGYGWGYGCDGGMAWLG